MSKVSNFFYDIQNDLFIDRKNNMINYSDGSEEYFRDLFSKIDNINPIELQSFIKDWATRYHLSIMRSNILDSVAEIFNKDSEVLELGGGIGAITGWLADNFKNVDVIEGSLSRAKALKWRIKNKKNIRVFVGDITNIEYPKERYDLISVIGVLEYLPFYSNENPKKICKDFLNNINKHLNKNGILAIAIENKLGVKYFSGCTEDHNGELFSGIMDYPKKSPITFSRNELDDLLRESGFINVQFYHVFPDYKLPELFFREDQAVYNMNPSLFTRGWFPDYADKREFLFLEPLFLESIFKAKLLHQFSNSFLVLCSNTEDLNLKSDWIVKKYWNKEITKPEFHHTINFIQKEDQIWVERKPFFYSVDSKVSKDIQFGLKSAPFIHGTNLLQQAYRSILEDPSYSGVVGILEKILFNLKQEFSIDGATDEEGYDYIDGAAVDYCLWNIIQDDSLKFQFVDRKWRYLKTITVDFVIFRNLNGLYKDVFPFIKEANLSDFVIKIMQKLFPKYDVRRLKYNLNCEEEFLKQILRPDVIMKSDVTLKKNMVEQLKILKKAGAELMFRELEKLLVTGDTFLWGAGIHTVNLLKVFQKMNFPLERIVGIVDSNPEKDQTFIQGIPVFSKENFLTNKRKSCRNIIISSKCFEEEIYSELQRLFGDEKINLIRLYHNGFDVDCYFE